LYTHTDATSNELDYFSHTAMRAHYLENFVETLPEHLQHTLRRIFPSAFSFMWVAKPLQGYATETQHGVTRVSFWYGATKHYNWVPVTGLLFFCASRLLLDTRWKHLYFDACTKRCIGVSSQEAAAALFANGNEHLSAGHFDTAIKSFEKALANATDKEEIAKYELAVRNAQDIANESTTTTGIV
jgi:hypothetical protein